MAYSGKYLCLCIVIMFIVSNLLMVLPTDAQTIPTPLVPEFKLSYTNNVYDVPTSTSQWSGEPIPDTSHHVDYRDIYVKVRNYPNDGYINTGLLRDGIKENLYYNVRIKSHFSNDWIEIYGQTSVYAANGSIIIGTWYWQASGTEVTTIGSISLNGPTNIIHSSKEIALGGEVDFQVKALIGYQNFEKKSFTGKESEWSDTQTIVFSNESNSSISPAPTDSLPNFGPTSSPTPNIGELTVILASIAIVISISSIILLLVYARHLKKSIKAKSNIRN